MLIKWPDKIKAGLVNNGLFDGKDFFPTLVAAAGGPKNLHGLLDEAGLGR